MKKSTLVKIISMILTAVLVLSFASCFNFGGGNKTEDEGEKITLYLDTQGGTLPEGQSDEIKVVIGEKIGKLPTPTKPGYNFIGWFEDGDERYPIDRKTEAEDYDMDIVAKWEAAGTLYAVEFVLGSGEDFVNEGTKSLYEVVNGNRISTVLDRFPDAKKEGNNFDGWQDRDTKQRVTPSTVVTQDMVLVPVWKQIIYCIDGTENHNWNAWQEADEATCTTPAQSSRLCNICGYTEYNITQEATGHKFGSWATAITENGIVRSRVCVECDEKEADPLQNIAYDAFQTPVIDGDCWGGDKGNNLFDGNYSDRPIAAKGTGALTVTITAKEAVQVDIIAVTGFGAAAYNVVVFYDDGTQKDLGVGAFGSGDSATKPFNVDASKLVTKIVITQPSPANGTDYWSEVSILVVPK